MVTHPDINPVLKGLTSVNKREPVFPFGDKPKAHAQYAKLVLVVVLVLHSEGR